MKLYQKLTKVQKVLLLMLISLILIGYVTVTNLKTAGQTTINGGNITTGTIKSSNYVANTSGTSINLTNGVIDSKNFKVDATGNMTCTNAKVNGGSIRLVGGTSSSPNFNIDSNDGKHSVYGTPGYLACGYILNNGQVNDCNIQANDTQASVNVSTYYGGANFHAYSDMVFMEVSKFNTSQDNTIAALINNNATQLYLKKNNQITIIEPSGITTPKVTQTSLESEKKNFEKFENGLETLKNIDIYKYNLKGEEDTDKKHIGFVIGNKYNYSKEVTSKENNGVDIYSFVSVCCKAIQEQQEQIEELKEKDRQKDEMIANLIDRIEKLEKGE